MLKKLKDVLSNGRQDSRFMGWKWRFVAGSGFGALITYGWLTSGEARHPIVDLIFFSAALAVIILGEVMALLKQDPVFRDVEIRGIALGGLVSLLLGLPAFQLGNILSPTALTGDISMTVFLGCYVIIRTVYVDLIHEEFSTGDET